jgi:FAD binding domain-containing protein
VRQHGDGVRVTAVRDTGAERCEIEVDYLVGCDGAHSLVREQAGIASEGADFDQRMVLAVFRSRQLHERLERFPLRTTYRVLEPELKGYWWFFGRVDPAESCRVRVCRGRSRPCRSAETAVFGGPARRGRERQGNPRGATACLPGGEQD